MPSAIDDLPPPPLKGSFSGIDDLPPPPSAQASDKGGVIKGAIDSLPMLGGLAGGILGTPLDAVSGPMGNIVGAVIGGYLGTSAKNLINSYYDPDSAPKTATGAVGQAAMGGLEQGLMQGTGEAVAPLVSKGIQAGANAAKWTGTKMLSSLGGVSPDVIKEYAQYSDRINGAPSVDKLKDISDEFVGKLAQDVDANKLTAEQANEAYKGIQSDLKDAYKTAGYNARDAMTSAQQTLKDAHNSRLQQLSGDVYDTVNKLKSDVQGGSAQALETLNKSNAKIDLSPVISEIDSTIERLNKSGTDEALAVADKLNGYKERLLQNQDTAQVGFQPGGKVETIKPPTYENTPESLQASGKLLPARYIMGSNEDQWLRSGLLGKQVAPPVEFQPIAPKLGTTNQIAAPDAKKLIQGLDQTTKYSPMAGAFDDVKNAAFKNVRASLDNVLKSSVPEYADAMKPVAADADLLNRVQDFGDKQSAASILNRINAPNQMDRAAALKELGKKYNADFIGGANPENLPEQQLVNKAQAAQDALRPDRVAQKIDQTLASSRQKAALDEANAGYQSAQEKLAPFKSLAPNGAGQTTAQQKLAQLGKGKNIELEDMFQKLGKLTDTDFVQAMKDNNIRDSFKKGATNGSRNTLMGATVGWLFGGATGGAIGAGAGRAVDQWGPAMTKRALDGAIKVARNPTVSTISQLELPEPIKRNMVIGLENYFAQGGQAPIEQSALRGVADSDGKVNRTPAKGPDAWAQKGLSNLGIQDAEMSARLMQDPRAKQLLIQASDLAPNSKAIKNIQNQIQKGFKR